MNEALVVRSLDMFDNVEEVDNTTTIYYTPEDLEAIQVTILMKGHGIQKFGVKHIIHVKGEGIGVYHYVEPKPSEKPEVPKGFPYLADQVEEDEEERYSHQGLVFFPFKNLIAIDIEFARKL